MNPFQTIQRRKPIPKRRAKPRRKTVENTDRDYLKWVRSLLCCVCHLDLYAAWVKDSWKDSWIKPLAGEREFIRATEAAHVGARGLSQKCSDRETIPLCALHHREGPESHHKLGKRFWAHHGIDRDALIKRLQEAYDAQR